MKVYFKHNNGIHKETATYPLAVAPVAAAPVADVVAILITGARIPVILLKLLARASPVPRWGAGNT